MGHRSSALQPWGLDNGPSPAARLRLYRLRAIADDQVARTVADGKPISLTRDNTILSGDRIRFIGRSVTVLLDQETSQAECRDSTPTRCSAGGRHRFR